MVLGRSLSQDLRSVSAARVRVFATGQGRKTDATDAHSVALAATRMAGLRPAVADQQLMVLRILADRRRSLGEDHIRMVCQLHQLRYPTEGRAYFDRKVAAGKTPMEAMRALKRRLSDIACRQMLADARAAVTGPGGHVGAATDSSAAGSHPSAGTSEKSLPGPAVTDPTPQQPAHSPGRPRRSSPAPDRSRRQAHELEPRPLLRAVSVQ